MPSLCWCFYPLLYHIPYAPHQGIWTSVYFLGSFVSPSHLFLYLYVNVFSGNSQGGENYTNQFILRYYWLVVAYYFFLLMSICKLIRLITKKWISKIEHEEKCKPSEATWDREAIMKFIVLYLACCCMCLASRGERTDLIIYSLNIYWASPMCQAWSRYGRYRNEQNRWKSLPLQSLHSSGKHS